MQESKLADDVRKFLRSKANTREYENMCERKITFCFSVADLTLLVRFHPFYDNFV